MNLPMSGLGNPAIFIAPSGFLWQTRYIPIGVGRNAASLNALADKGLSIWDSALIKNPGSNLKKMKVFVSEKKGKMELRWNWLALKDTEQPWKSLILEIVASMRRHGVFPTADKYCGMADITKTDHTDSHGTPAYLVVGAKSASRCGKKMSNNKNESRMNFQ